MPSKIGFIGQGWIGRNYADDFERRGYEVVRYGLEEPHVNNGSEIAGCEIVFIAVPTPSTPQGFNSQILREVIKKVGKESTAVIKSTILPGTTEKLQEENPGIYVMHSPEFLTEATAAHDAAHPIRNIIGIPKDNDSYRARAQAVLEILPPAKYSKIVSARTAELIKYGGNNWFFFKVVYINLLYDLACKLGVRWDELCEAMAQDPRIGSSHMIPVHKSGTPGGDAYQAKTTDAQNGGRGAGGHCFIKDFAAFSELFENLVGDELGLRLLYAIRDKNIDLLVSTGKDLDLLAGVYGKEVLKQAQEEK